jgi:hypothetical protein
MFCSLDVPARAPGRTRSGGPGRRAPVLLLGLVVWLTVGAALAADRRVELLVFGPGDDVFGRYGHAALRVVGPGSADRVFNFGITDWTKPNYIRDFLTGRVRFWGNVKPWERARKSYVKWDRTIVRYPLELTPDEVDGLVARMEHDVLPEHREYVYDTFRDNCATRLRDYLDTATGGAVRRSLADDPLGPSYREDVRVAFAAYPGLLLLTEIIPGLPLDAPRSTWERMYRPAVLGDAIARVQVTRSGVARPLTAGPIVDRRRDGPEPLTGWPDLGQVIIGAAAALLLGWVAAVRGRPARTRATVALMLWGPAVALSLLLTVVAVGTIWPDMQQNWLLLALPPTDLALLPALRAVRAGRPPQFAGAVRAYLVFRAVSSLALAGLAPVVDLFAGPLPPRLLALAVVAALWTALLPRAGASSAGDSVGADP